VVGPKDMIGNIDRAASAIDGGPPQPIQRIARKALEPSYADQETVALRKVFAKKRQIMENALTAMGIDCLHSETEEQGTVTKSTFYVWASIEKLPPPLNDGFSFFREGLKHKVMTVPGVFFDVNPKTPNQRPPEASPYHHWVRFSFGPPEDNLRLGLDRLSKMITDFKSQK